MTRGDRSEPARVLAFRPNVRKLERLIRQIAEDSSRVSLTEHALERMEQRGITDFEVFGTLRTGSVIADSLRPGKAPGDQVCRVVKPIEGSREVGVITVVKSEERLIVLTVQWEDLR